GEVPAVGADLARDLAVRPVAGPGRGRHVPGADQLQAALPGGDGPRAGLRPVAVGAAHGVEGGLGGERREVDDAGQMGEGPRLDQPPPVAVERVENVDLRCHLSPPDGSSMYSNPKFEAPPKIWSPGGAWGCGRRRSRSSAGPFSPWRWSCSGPRASRPPGCRTSRSACGSARARSSTTSRPRPPCSTPPPSTSSTGPRSCSTTTSPTTTGRCSTGWRSWCGTSPPTSPETGSSPYSWPSTPDWASAG